MEGEKFKAVCSECGKECEIPFKPTSGRPVKCNSCFKPNKPNYKNNNDRGFNNKRQGFSNNRQGFNNKRQDFHVVCAKCGKATTVPFKPTQGGKPVLCRDCFSKK